MWAITCWCFIADIYWFNSRPLHLQGFSSKRFIWFISQRFYSPLPPEQLTPLKMFNWNSDVPLALRCNCICVYSVCVSECVCVWVCVRACVSVSTQKMNTLPPSRLQKCKYLLPVDIALLNITYIVITIWLLLVWLLSLKGLIIAITLIIINGVVNYSYG